MSRHARSPGSPLGRKPLLEENPLVRKRNRLTSSHRRARPVVCKLGSLSDRASLGVREGGPMIIERPKAPAVLRADRHFPLGGEAAMGVRQLNVPGVLAFLLVVIILFFTAWYAARKLLSPRDVFGLDDKRISRLEFFRSLGGLVTIVATTLPFRGSSRVIGDYIFHVVEALVLGIISLFVCIVVAVTIARSRGWIIARIWRPLLKIALTFGSLLAGDALGHVPMVTHLLNMKHPTLKGAFVVSISGWLVLLAFWLLMFGLWALCYSARYFYCAGEVHPVLAPLVAIVAVTMIAVLDIGRTKGWFGGIENLLGKVVGQAKPSFLLHPAPPGLILTLIVGGWLSTMILAGFEWRAIRMDGISLREVL